MRRFPPDAWKTRSWWPVYATSVGSKRRVLRRLREEGPLESGAFDTRPDEFGPHGPPGGSLALRGEDKRSIKLLWHAGRVGIKGRKHFRCLYDLAERVYPADVDPARLRDLEDAWLLVGLSGNGIASQRDLMGYMTDADLKAPDRKRVIARNLASGRVREVRVTGHRGPFYVLPEHLEGLEEFPEPSGTTLVCPFDSFLWQRKRAEAFLDFEYRIEIYTPAKKRRFGYYVLPILHDGRFVGRLDPKVHRDRGELEIKALFLEPGFRADAGFRRALGETLHDLKAFVGAETLSLPAKWSAIG